MTDAALEIVLRRDRTIIMFALLIIVAVAWAYVVWLAADMDMGGMDMSGFRMIPAGIGIMAPIAAPWSFELELIFIMWTVMMIGMMTSSVAPMILIHARVARQAAAQHRPFAATAWFTAGYLVAWIGFALVATCSQWALERASLLTPTMEIATNTVGAFVLILAGIYQWTPLKDACLAQCQAPLTFIHRHGGFRRDAPGALWLGMRHGAYCIGCCWALMALLFVGGVMNVLWIAAISVLVLAEKVVPGGRLLARMAGTGFVAAGLWLLANEFR